MKPFFLFLLLAAIGNAIYHVGQKALSSTTNPMLLLMAVYGFAFLFSALALPFFRGGAPAAGELGHLLSWPVLFLAGGAFLIEIGFLLAYRTGGSLQWSGSFVNGLSALILIPVALLFFRESFSLTKILGVALTLSGIVVLSRH